MTCPFCHIAVAAGDRERIQVGLEVYHGGCRKKKIKQDEELGCRVKPTHQYPLDFSIPAQLQ